MCRHLGKDGKAKGNGKDGKVKGKSKVDEALAKGIKCYFCGKYGHKRADCPKKAGRDTHTPPQQQGQSAASSKIFFRHFLCDVWVNLNLTH